GTSYSGPASSRLLSASCGQNSHTRLYQPANNYCYVFVNLAKLGFTQHLMKDHNGVFCGFLKEVRENVGIQSELMYKYGLPTSLQSI
ncbi:cellulose biosynthesis protein BcsG, partial [Salmonella enterica]|uniref:cellulose biosynthesis protein BcsG n=1 Tax=Salmonella enterica TaxID=28901 RepID=UPI0020C2618D